LIGLGATLFVIRGDSPLFGWLPEKGECSAVLMVDEGVIEPEFEFGWFNEGSIWGPRGSKSLRSGCLTALSLGFVAAASFIGHGGGGGLIGDAFQTGVDQGLNSDINRDLGGGLGSGSGYGGW